MRWFCSALALLAVIGCVARPATPSSVSVLVSEDIADVGAAAESYARQFGAAETLIVFDLDDTLLTASQPLGSDEWFNWARERFANDEEVARYLFARQGALMHEGAMQPVQPRTSSLVEALQARGHPVMILTSRGSDYYLQTFRELRRNSLFFNGIVSTYEPSKKPYCRADGDRPVRYADGVLMVSGQHKGVHLLDLMGRARYQPRAVVFIDDGKKNVERVASSLRDAGIEGTLYHYVGSASAKAQALEALNSPSTQSAWKQLLSAMETVASIMQSRNFRLSDEAPSPTCTSIAGQ